MITWITSNSNLIKKVAEIDNKQFEPKWIGRGSGNIIKQYRLQSEGTNAWYQKGNVSQYRQNYNSVASDHSKMPAPPIFSAKLRKKNSTWRGSWGHNIKSD